MVNTREIAHKYRLTHWAQVLQERSASGLTIKAYCKQIGICANTYFYWQRKLRETAFVQMQDLTEPSQQTGLRVSGFTEVQLVEAAPDSVLLEASAGNLRIEVGGMHIVADSGYPLDKLAALLRELQKLC